MQMVSVQKAILSPLSIISTFTFITFLGLQAHAEPIYHITVVSKASVMTGPSEAMPRPFACKTTQNISKQVSKMGYEETNDRNLVKIQQVDTNTVLFATQNTNEGSLNSVTLYFAVKSDKTVKYYPLTEIDMERFELPKITFDGQLLTVEADTLSIDPNDKNVRSRVPIIKGQTLQKIRPGLITPNGLQLHTLSCTR